MRLDRLTDVRDSEATVPPANKPTRFIGIGEWLPLGSRQVETWHKLLCIFFTGLELCSLHARTKARNACFHNRKLPVNWTGRVEWVTHWYSCCVALKLSSASLINIICTHAVIKMQNWFHLNILIIIQINTLISKVCTLNYVLWNGWGMLCSAQTVGVDEGAREWEYYHAKHVCT